MAEHSLYDEIWGKWYFKDQPIKVAKLENAFGDHFSNYTFSAFKQNIVGSRIDTTFNPALFLKLFGGGAADAATGLANFLSWSWNAGLKWAGYYSGGKKVVPSRPSFPASIYTAAAYAIAAYGFGGPLFTGPAGRTNIVITDQTELMYFGTSVRIRRAVNAFEFSFKEDDKNHKWVTAVLVAGMAGLFATSLAIRLAWYDFDPVLAKQTERDNSDIHSVDDEGIKDYESRWATPYEACKLWIPLAEGIWASLLILIDSLLARQIAWVEWRLKALRREVAQHEWDLKHLDRIGDKLMRQNILGESVQDDTVSIVEIHRRLAILDEKIAKKQAKLDQYTTELESISED